MSNPLGVQKFLDSDLAESIRAELRSMMDDPQFNTQSTYSPSTEEKLAFDDKHIAYLSKHRTLNPQHYLSNLRLMTRISK
jgi:hypothetical protein